MPIGDQWREHRKERHERDPDDAQHGTGPLEHLTPRLGPETLSGLVADALHQVHARDGGQLVGGLRVGVVGFAHQSYEIRGSARA